MKRFVAILLAGLFMWVPIARGEEVAPDPQLSAQVKGEFLGQDGHDHVQKSPAPGPNDIQDLHFRITNLPADDAIVSAIFTRQGGGQWAYEHPWGPWKAHLVREEGSTAADFFCEPSHDEDHFGVDARIVFASGRVAAFSFDGGKSDSRLLMPHVGLKLE